MGDAMVWLLGRERVIGYLLAQQGGSVEERGLTNVSFTYDGECKHQASLNS